jgi:hypothetical protein
MIDPKTVFENRDFIKNQYRENNLKNSVIYWNYASNDQKINYRVVTNNFFDFFHIKFENKINSNKSTNTAYISNDLSKKFELGKNYYLKNELTGKKTKTLIIGVIKENQFVQNISSTVMRDFLNKTVITTAGYQEFLSSPYLANRAIEEVLLDKTTNKQGVDNFISKINKKFNFGLYSYSTNRAIKEGYKYQSDGWMYDLKFYGTGIILILLLTVLAVSSLIKRNKEVILSEYSSGSSIQNIIKTISKKIIKNQIFMFVLTTAIFILIDLMQSIISNNSIKGNYFLGVSPEDYFAIIETFIVNIPMLLILFFIISGTYKKMESSLYDKN